MPGKGLAVSNGDDLVKAVAELALTLGLESRAASGAPSVTSTWF